MKLETVKIQGFRSIENIELDNCGEFNVLIGKNNAGKSNILTAIQAFFSSINGKSIISTQRSIGKSIDFFDKKDTGSIKITLTFLLSPTEKETLIQDIIKDAPQMRNALEGIDPAQWISITLTAISENNLCFVSEIIMSNSNKLQKRTILKVDLPAAAELESYIVLERKHQQTIKSLQNFIDALDREDWRSITGDQKSVSRPGVRNLLRRRFPPDILDNVLSQMPTVVDTMTYDEFISVSQSYIQKLKEEASSNLQDLQRNKIDTFAGEESTIPPYILNILQKVSNMKVLYLKEQRKAIGRDEAARLLTLKKRRNGPAVLQRIQETVVTLLGVKIDAFESDTLTPEGKEVAELDVDDFLIEVNGSGIRESLRLILDVEFEKPEIILVEEPEIHLHPALETSLMQYLKRISKDRQILLTTHSTNFLDTAEMKNVYLVSKTKSTKIQLLDFEEAESQIPKELGIRLSSLFMFDKLVFVEGPSDVGIIREWASIMNVNLNQSNVGFIIMGGSRNIIHYAAEGTLSFLKKRQVDLWFLIDRDEKSGPEIAKIEKDLGLRARVKILKKREIENYLICARAITEFIKLKREMSIYDKDISNIKITEADVQCTIKECTEKLKQLAIDKRLIRFLCKPIHRSFDWGPESLPSSIVEKIINENKNIIKNLEETNAKIQEVYEEQLRDVNTIWEANKLNLVPGDHLLDMICQKYNIRFKKEGDGPRLAALMNEDEIDDEMKVIIRQIGTR